MSEENKIGRRAIRQMCRDGGMLCAGILYAWAGSAAFESWQKALAIAVVGLAVFLVASQIRLMGFSLVLLGLVSGQALAQSLSSVPGQIPSCTAPASPMLVSGVYVCQTPLVTGTTSGTARDGALAIAAETAASSAAAAAQTSANTNANNIAGIMAKLPVAASAIAGTMYVSTCSVTVNTATATSTFCPVATDSGSATKRTYPAGALTVGKAFKLEGGGSYTVPTGNLNTADIKIMVGGAAVMSMTTPAAPVGNNQGIVFSALCTVRTTTTIACQGVFTFVVAGATGAPAPFNQTGTFNPAVDNIIDVTGDWNTNAGMLTTQTTTVTQAVLTALN